jgi:hypothetical protein
MISFLKDEADWENLIFLGSVFQSVGAKKEKDLSFRKNVLHAMVRIILK